MADWCTKCQAEMFGDDSNPESMIPDIDIKEIFNGLEDGHYTSVICEGCAMKAIAKHNGRCAVFYDDECCPVVAHRGKWLYYDIETNTVMEEILELNKIEEN